MKGVNLQCLALTIVASAACNSNEVDVGPYSGFAHGGAAGVAGIPGGRAAASSGNASTPLNGGAGVGMQRVAVDAAGNAGHGGALRAGNAGAEMIFAATAGNGAVGGLGKASGPFGGSSTQLSTAGTAGVAGAPPKPVSSGGSAGTRTSAAQAGTIATAGQGGSGACGHALAQPDEAIFVATPTYATAGASGNDQHCGTLQTPCASIDTAVAQAFGLQRKLVCVARGIYVDTVRLLPGIRVEGGWEIVDGAWRAIDSADANSAVMIQAPQQQNLTVIAKDLGGSATLARLKVVSKTKATLGESLYGILASGTTTRLTLDRVDIAVDDGGSGAPGTVGGNGSNGPASGSCPPDLSADAGKAGAAVSNGVDAPEGVFSESGYVPANGTDGQPGNRGHNGSRGGSPKAVSDCDGATEGVNGCGSGGGLPGGGAKGGGSSIALYVWDATVEVLDGSLESRNGGNGGEGKNGGLPGVPTLGRPGESKSCLHCTSSTTIYGSGSTGNSTRCDSYSEVESKGGTAGGDGGAGSPGGNGGNGAGGFSYAYYLSPAAHFEATAATKFTFGSPGVGRGSAKAGKSGRTNRL